MTTSSTPLDREPTLKRQLGLWSAVAVLVGPSHLVGFEGVSISPSGGFETPFGVAPIDADCARAIAGATPVVVEHRAAHAREHSLEMQLPFLAHLAPGLPIVPLVMGYQTKEIAYALGDALATALRGRKALLVASTDLFGVSPIGIHHRQETWNQAVASIH